MKKKMQTNSGMLVSILVPIYNVNRYIEKCAISLFEQSYENIEYIFVDDCSPDNSVEILYNVLNRYPNRLNQVKIVHHETNKGLGNARNTALKNATGEFIIHVDSDDYIETDMIEIMLERAVEKNVDMVICDFNVIYDSHTHRSNIIFDDDKEKYLALLLKRQVLVSIVGRLIKRELLMKNNLFSMPNLNHGEDYAIMPRIVYYANRIIKTNRPLYNYIRYNVNSYTHSVNGKAIDDIILANKILIDFFTVHTTDKQLPLDESRAINAITLFYCSGKCYYDNIANTYSDLKIWSLDVNIVHKLLLMLSKMKMYNLLHFMIGIINIARAKLK